MESKLEKIFVVFAIFMLFAGGISTAALCKNSNYKDIENNVYYENENKQYEHDTSTTTTKIKTIKFVTKKTTKKVSGKENKEEYKSYAHYLILEYGWTETDYENIVKLWTKESNWSIYDSYGSCYGIPQACPGNKMISEGNDYKTNYKTQIKWGLKYIKQRYGTPTKAWEHSKKKGWY